MKRVVLVEEGKRNDAVAEDEQEQHNHGEENAFHTIGNARLYVCITSHIVIIYTVYDHDK